MRIIMIHRLLSYYPIAKDTNLLLSAASGTMIHDWHHNFGQNIRGLFKIYQIIMSSLAQGTTPHARLTNHLSQCDEII